MNLTVWLVGVGIITDHCNMSRRTKTSAVIIGYSGRGPALKKQPGSKETPCAYISITNPFPRERMKRWKETMRLVVIADRRSPEYCTIIAGVAVIVSILFVFSDLVSLHVFISYFTG